MYIGFRFLRSAPISWLSLKQKMVALSTCEAEYVATATAACQAVWLCQLPGELISVKAHPPALMVDNQPAIALAKNPVLHDQSKDIDVKFHFLRDCIDEGRSSLSSSKLVGNSRTSSPSRSAVFGPRN